MTPSLLRTSNISFPWTPQWIKKKLRSSAGHRAQFFFRSRPGPGFSSHQPSSQTSTGVSTAHWSFSVRLPQKRRRRLFVDGRLKALVCCVCLLEAGLGVRHDEICWSYNSRAAQYTGRNGLLPYSECLFQTVLLFSVRVVHAASIYLTYLYPIKHASYKQ